MIFLHGFLGNKSNWRSFAKKLIEAEPQWGAMLVDLPMHGDSQDFSGPYTITTAAGEILKFSRSLSAPCRGILGHSFGGKVALKTLALEKGAFDIAWLLDFIPWAQPNKSNASKAYEILAILESLANSSYTSRNEFVEKLLCYGQGKDTALWLAMNLRGYEGDLKLNIKSAALRSYLDDYHALDLSSAILEKSTTKPVLNFALGGRSSALSPKDRNRIIALGKDCPEKIQTQLLANAGHNLHMDSPDELHELVKNSLHKH